MAYHKWHTSNSHLFLLDGATVTLPFSLPLLVLTYINRQQRDIHASRAAARLGAHAVRPSSFWRCPPKNTYGGPFIPSAQNTYGGAHCLPYPTTPLTLRNPKPNYAQLTPKGPTWGGAFSTPDFGPMGKWAQIKKKVGCYFGNPHFGPLGVTCPICSFGHLIISGTPGPPSYLPIHNLSPANAPILETT